MEMSEFNSQALFPKELEVRCIEETEKQIIIQLKSRSKSCICPHCGKEIREKHSTCKRKLQDLPILGKQVRLTVNIYQYECPDCKKITTESIDGFLRPNSRMTERCGDFIVRLALGTSCEGASRILKAMGITYSGDSITRLLLKRVDALPAKVGDVIGVDDFAYRKGQTYGTIIVDGRTHRPIALLEGRDGKSLKEWLKDNKHIKVVTRDRASEYAKAISEELPDAMQVADRFHLHHNFLEVIKKVLNTQLPAAIPAEAVEKSSSEEDDKKRVVLIG